MKDPSIRFLDDNGQPYPDARRITFGDVYKERKEKGDDSLQILSVSIHTGVSDQELDEENLGKEVRRSEDKSVYKKAESGDLVFNMMRAWQGAVGSVANTGMVSPAYIVAKPDKSVDPVYIDYLVQTKRAIHEFDRLSYGVTDFRKRLYWESFVKVPLNLPSVKEQNKIAALFAEVDKLISAASDEIYALKEAKKGMMQKVFSREVRFKRDDGTDYPEWRTINFNDAFTAIGSNTFSRAELSDKGVIRNVHYGDILTVLGSIVDPEKDNLPFIANEGNIQKLCRNYLKDGDIIFADTAEDETVGKAIEMTNCVIPVVSGLHTTPCRPVEGVFEPGYLGYYLNSTDYHDQLRPLMQGIKVTSVSRTAMGETKLNFPAEHEEQQKIASLFLSMDDAIAAARDELQGYKDLKKYLLQNMFV